MQSAHQLPSPHQLQPTDQPRSPRVLLALLFAWAGACDSTPVVIDGGAGLPPPDAVARDGTRAGLDDVPPEPPKEPPKLSSVKPPRGAWFGPGGSVSVSGQVEATTAPITGVTVSGEPATLENGEFGAVPAVRAGINIVGVRVEAEDGERTVDGRSFFYGETHPPGTTIPGGIRLHLSPEFLDDDEPDLDDAAAAAEALATSPGFLAGLTKPLDTEYAVMTPHTISFSAVEVDIVPLAGELELELTIHDLHVAFDLQGKGFLETVLTGPGTMDAELGTVLLFLALAKSGPGAITAEVTYAKVDLDGFSVYTESLPSFGDAESLVDLMRQYVEGQVEELAKDMIGELMVKLLESFAYETTFGEDPPLAVSLELAEVAVATHGVNMALDVTMAAPAAPGVPLDLLTGSLRTESTFPDEHFSGEPVAFLIDDDVLNQLAFALWHGGKLGGIDAAPADVPGADLSGLPEVFQPLERVTMDTLLPPTLGPRLLDADDFPFELALGELHLGLHAGGGKVFEMSINARTGLCLDQSEDGTITVRLDARPKFVELHVGVYEAPSNFDPGNIAALMRLGVPPLLRDLSKQLEFRLPGLPLEELLPLDSVAGKVIAFPDMSARVVGPERNLLILEGRPVIQDAPPAAPEPAPDGG